MICLDDIICEAKCCAACLGAKYAHDFKYGESTNETKYNFLKLMSFIRTLCRNQTTYTYNKELVAVQNVEFSSLQKQNSFLTLTNNKVVVCTKTEISPCLCDSEISHIIEQVKLLCSTCNCNCN